MRRLWSDKDAAQREGADHQAPPDRRHKYTYRVATAAWREKGVFLLRWLKPLQHFREGEKNQLFLPACVLIHFIYSRENGNAAGKKEFRYLKDWPFGRLCARVILPLTKVNTIILIEKNHRVQCQ